MDTKTTPRRDSLDLNTPAEIQIRESVKLIERIGADPRLTAAITLLGKARELVADFVDTAKMSEPPTQMDVEIMTDAQVVDFLIKYWEPIQQHLTEDNPKAFFEGQSKKFLRAVALSICEDIKG